MINAEKAESKCKKSRNSSGGTARSTEEKGRENSAKIGEVTSGTEVWGGKIKEEDGTEGMTNLDVQCLKGKVNSLKMTSLDKKTVLEAKSYNL